MTEDTADKPEMSKDDWLWRLERLQEELKQSVPSQNLRVEFFLIRDTSRRHYADELERLDRGRGGKSLASMSIMVDVWDKDDILWFRLGEYREFCFTKWDDEREQLRYFPTIPSDLDRSNATLAEWLVRYYVEPFSPGQDYQQCEPLLRRVNELESSLLALTSQIPEPMTDNIRSLRFIPTWPTALLVLAMIDIHPSHSAWGMVQSYEGLLERSHRKYGAAPVQPDRILTLGRDYRTACDGALKGLRRAVLAKWSEYEGGRQVGSLVQSIRQSVNLVEGLAREDIESPTEAEVAHAEAVVLDYLVGRFGEQDDAKGNWPRDWHECPEAYGLWRRSIREYRAAELVRLLNTAHRLVTAVSVPRKAESGRIVPTPVDATEFLERLLGSPDNTELTPSEFAFLDVCLENPTQTMERVRQKGLDKLNLIRDYNRRLYRQPVMSKEKNVGTAGRKRKARRELQNEKLLLTTALATHHNLYSDKRDEVNYEPATQKQLLKLLPEAWNQSKISRAMKQLFGPKPSVTYKRSCRSEAIAGFLKKHEDGSYEPEAGHYKPLHPTDRQEMQALND